MKKILIATTLAAASLSACTTGTNTKSELKSEINKDMSLNEKLSEIQKKYDILGMSVVAQEKGKTVFERYAGLKDHERELAVDANTKYRVASISKYVVTTGLMKLYEQGKFDLEEDVSTYLGYPLRNPHHPDKKITIKHILTHSSGLSDSDYYFNFLMDTYRQKSPKLQEVFTEGNQYYNDSTWNTFEPGVHFEYSNLGFGVIGNLIEKFSGKRFDVYMKEELLTPLGIQGSFNPEDLANIDDLSTLYRRKELSPDSVWVPQTDHYQGERPEPRKDLETYQVGDNGVAFGPQGSFRGSAEDLAKIMQLHLNKGTYNGVQLLKPETVALMDSAHFVTDGDKLFKEVGLCTHITEDMIPGTRLYGHTGDAYGLHSVMFFDPKTEKGVVIIMNSSMVEESELGFYTVELELMRAIWGELFNEEELSMNN
ncbi:serine hydrolase domain-containing protein [Algivirga pacifica]|uniref:Serine hydrolase domain-containing protein n=1 Tax=Algivirga pacifica TaxID=1162670 RepID=A0ABP9CX12_9BACT